MTIAAKWANSWRRVTPRPLLTNILLAIALVELQAADGHRVMLNTGEVTYFREPRDGEHFVKGAKCLVFLSDGRFISVIETCDEVEQKFQQAK